MATAELELILDRVEKIADTIRDGAAASEQLGRLAPAVIDALHEAEIFRMMVPNDLGGFELTIPESLVVFERVASFDASTGWVLAILGYGPLFARFLSQPAFESLCADPTGLMAGTLNPATARAEPVGDGYHFSGRATYLSGSAHAKWIMASAIVMDGESPRMNDTGIEIRSGLFPIEAARSTPGT